MWETIIYIMFTILSVAAALVITYLEIKKKIIEQANAEIANAQDATTDNAERMAYVVAQLKKLVPAPLRFIFTDQVITRIAQAAFDKIKEYAKKHAAEKLAEAKSDGSKK